MKELAIVALISLALSLVFGAFSIPVLRRIKAGQTILKYVETHKVKSGTPTMGGLFFIIPAVIVFFVCCRAKLAIVSAVIGLAFMGVGFIDDFIKVKFKRNEGLTATQKIIFQGLIAVVAGVFCYENGITHFNIPFTNESLDLGVITILFVAVIFIATTNCVNLTDGLDGLAGTSCAVYLIFLTLLISSQVESFGVLRFQVEEYSALKTLCVSLFGALLGFLLFNTNKASVFMGDTGSLSLGGFVAAISIFSSNALFIPVIGITFVLSGISVIVQVFVYKRTKKRVLLMAPLHHHFQLKGYAESKITYAYGLITAIMGVVSVIPYWG